MEFKKSKFGYEITKENYVLPNKRCSLPYFSDFMVRDDNYLYYPKKFSEDYFFKLTKFYETQQKKYLSSHQIQNWHRAMEGLKILKMTEDSDFKKRILNLQKTECEASKDEFVTRYLSRLFEIKENFNLEECVQGRIYSSLWLEKQKKEVEKNFDLNMRFFEALDEKEFNAELNNFLKRNSKFVEVNDLRDIYYKSGYYIMVLDKYKQIYIGTSFHVGKRIEEHWKKRKPFDRLIFPWHAVESSVLSIDAFMAKDTTRIYVYQTSKTYEMEDRFIQDFPRKFLLNRVSGGNELILPLEKKKLEENSGK
ncbi:MAG: hypothetical protein J6J24_02740 [Clostridia bacterium]|nr:hypothetical protein [Clostridia bacterium]